MFEIFSISGRIIVPASDLDEGVLISDWFAITKNDGQQIYDRPRQDRMLER